jgi:hypothetical protein
MSAWSWGPQGFVLGSDVVRNAHWGLDTFDRNRKTSVNVRHLKIRYPWLFIRISKDVSISSFHSALLVLIATTFIDLITAAF